MNFKHLFKSTIGIFCYLALFNDLITEFGSFILYFVCHYFLLNVKIILLCNVLVASLLIKLEIALAKPQFFIFVHILKTFQY